MRRAAAKHDRDLAFVRRVTEGDRAAENEMLGTIARVFEPAAGRMVARAPWLASHRDDLLQRFQLRLFERDYRDLRSYAGRASLETWLRVIASRFLSQQAGRLKPKREVDLERIAEPVDPGDTPEQVQLARGDASAVRRAVATLDERDQTLLALLFEQDMSAVDAAPLVGLTPSGVRMRKARALAKLAVLLKELGPEENRDVRRHQPTRIVEDTDDG